MTNINGLVTPKWQDQKADFSKWSTGLDDLSEDPIGIKVFESFLHTEGYLQYLEFLWACEGMKNIGHKKSSLVPQIVNCIYSHYIASGVLNNSATEPILNILRQSVESNTIQHQMSYNEMVDILNDLKIQIDLYLRDEIYPKFLKSSIFLEATQQHDRQGFQENNCHTAAPCNVEEVEIKDPNIIGHGPSLYHRKIIFVLNNDDLPTHQTLITTNGNSKQKACDPENFVKELTEKLQLLKLDQEREEANLTKIAREAELNNQSIFCTKLTEALQEHIMGKESVNSTKSIKCSNFSPGDDGTVKKHVVQMTNQTIEKIKISCHKKRLKSCLQNFTIFRSTRKVRANMQKCGKYSMSCVKQKRYEAGRESRVSKYLTKSRSLSFSDSDPEFCDEVLCKNSYANEKQPRRNGVPHSSSYPSSMDRIQIWMNESNIDVVRHLDTVKLLNK